MIIIFRRHLMFEVKRYGHSVLMKFVNIPHMDIAKVDVLVGTIRLLHKRNCQKMFIIS